MNSGVRIVKQGKNDSVTSVPIVQDERTAREGDREIVITVKSWIAELEQRRRSEGRAPSSALNNDQQNAA